MKMSHLSYFVFFVAFSPAFQVVGNGNFPKEPRSFDVRITQNGFPVEIKNNKVKLEKQAFELIFEFSEPMGVLVNASFENETFKFAFKNEPLEALPGFQETGMAEALLNPDNELIVANTAPSYWFYDSQEKHRFNSIRLSSEGIICTRFIEQVWNRQSDLNQQISDVESTLYLVFVTYDWSEDYASKLEIQREYIKIKWKK